MRIGRSGTLLIVLGLAAVGLPPIAFWVNNRGEENLEQAHDIQREVILGAMGALNAETGVRGYVLTGQEDFREPYDIGLQQVQQSSERLDGLVEDEDVAAQTDTVLQAFERWRAEFASLEIARVGEGDLSGARSITALEEGERLFDEVRAVFDLLLVRLAEETEEAEDARDQAELLQFALLVLAAAALAGFAAVLLALFASRRRQEEALGRVRRELASERELSEQSKEILATASHELRNPLTGLLLSAQVLQEEANETGNEEVGMMASEMAAAARRAADLVTELLDFTRLEAGRMRLATDEIAPRAIVRRAVEDVQMSYTDVEIDVTAEGGAATTVTGDFARLRMVVRNLLENAYRYGAPPLRVRITNGGPGVEIHVEDSGPGVPSAEREAVFERYQRGTTSGERDGTGIGLFMSRGIVEMHGGSIRIESSPLGGADFVVVLPRG
ncbi:MAG: ATP-binding protein [Dehalococcoidia bacterium]